MFKSNTDAHVYKYPDLTSKSVEYISIDELALCDWQDAGDKK